jgi:hypothetical protein
MADITDLYYAGDPIIGYGTQMLVGQDDGSPETFVAVPEVNTITPGDMTTGVIPVTHLRSPGRHQEKRGTIRDSGPFTLECNYNPLHGAHKISGGDGFLTGRSLVALWQTVAEANFRLVLPDESSVGGSPGTGQVIDIRGTITRYQIGAIGNEEKIGCTIEITPLRDYSDGLPA